MQFLTNKLLGIDSMVLSQTSPSEKNLYNLSGILLGICLLVIFISDAYSGYLYSGTIVGVVTSAMIIGFIHYSIYRLSLLTLTTRPFVEKEVDANKLKKTIKRLIPSISGLLRWVFTGFIAIAVAFPASTLLHHKQAMEIQDYHRIELLKDIPPTSKAFQDIKTGNFPFLVFESMLQYSSFRMGVLFFTIMLFLPLFLLSRLRNKEIYQYTRILRDIQKEEILLNYNTTIKDSQRFLDKEFETNLNLETQCIYADAPFNSEFKNEQNRNFGNREAFYTYLKSL
jgi:hypothetical protein